MPSPRTLKLYSNFIATKMDSTLKAKESQSDDNIILAADQGRLDLVTTLLENGVDPNTVDEVGTSALHNAAKQGHWEIARLLLERKASPHIKDGNNATPIILAAKAGQKQTARLLLECGIPISEMDEREAGTLVRVAALYGHTEIVQLLLDLNVPTLVMTGKETALHLAAKKGHHDVCDLLLKHDKNLTRSIWERMTGPALEVYSKDYTGVIPFQYAVTKNHEKTVEVFLRNHPDLASACDKDKEPFFFDPIHSVRVDLVRIFLENGVDIELKGKYGQRALHRAVAADSRKEYNQSVDADKTSEIIHLLLAHGASVTAKDNYGVTPELCTLDPKMRMILRNHGVVRSKGEKLPSVPKVSAPPPEYRE